MVQKRFSWKTGATLEEHSKCKHKIVREYLARYLSVRCQLPQQSRFRLAIVDGFAGGGRYKCGSPGSPVIFIEELQAATRAFNIRRRNEGMSELEIECLLLLNDYDPDVIELLKQNLSPLIASLKEEERKLHLRVEYSTKKFEIAYPDIKDLIHKGRYQNVLFNLDQCGTSKVDIQTIKNIVTSFSSAEIFYTFGIETLVSFLKKSDQSALNKQLRPFGITTQDLTSLDQVMNKSAWLGAAERIVFNSFSGYASYVSPFSINNPAGWRYWLIHFASSFRARQEYNDILHQNSSSQAHFGRSGLNMLSYDPSEDGSMLYLFDGPGRIEAKKQLYDDIPRLVTNHGDAVSMQDFYSSIYNDTPAHSLDIHSAIIDNPDLQVITEDGGERRKANTIRASDTLRLKKQRSFFPLF
jgi:three-Cys-motif partner protein